MYIICCGMIRSASTWQYNIVCQLLKTVMPIEQIGFHFKTSEDFLKYHTHKNSNQITVFKIHDGYPIFESLLKNKEAIGFYSFRDPRDVAFSTAHKLNMTIEELILNTSILTHCKDTHAFWKRCRNVFYQTYDHIIDDNIKSIRQIADFLSIHFSVTFSEEVIINVFQKNTLSANLNVIKQFLINTNIDSKVPDNVLLYEPDTLLHWNHIRSQQKKWYELATAEQIVLLAELFGEWLITENYEKNDNWASSALKHLNYIQTKKRLLELENELKKQLNHIKEWQTFSKNSYLSLLTDLVRKLHRRIVLFLK